MKENTGSMPGSFKVLRDATQQQLERAVAHNHAELFALHATSQGGNVTTKNGLTWTYCGAGKEAMVLFPVLTETNAGPLLDEMMDHFRQQPPCSAGCWSLFPPQPTDLGVKLLARGFQPGWQPSWMFLDTEKINTGHAVPPALEIRADNFTSINDVQHLPYGGNDGSVANILAQQYPERAQRFIALQDGAIVAHSCVFYTTGAYGIAGLYNVGVAPHARNQGIGKAVVTAACLHAKEKGYRYAMLNGTGRRMYEQVGFRWIGNGQTWWLMNKNYISNKPSPARVALIEAVGNGHIDILNKSGNNFSIAELNTPTANGMTLMQLAIHCKQPASADWLASHGVAYTVLDAWDMGWKDRAAALLKNDSNEVNRLYGQLQETLLHTAAERNDTALAQLVLAHHPDLTIKDKVYNATPLDWAKHLKHPAVAKLIEEYKP